MNFLDQAAWLIEEQGWVRGEFKETHYANEWDDEQSVIGYCIEGAVTEAMTNGQYAGYLIDGQLPDEYEADGMKAACIIADVLREQYPAELLEAQKRFGFNWNNTDDLIVTWNDRVCDGAAKCVAILEKASVKWEEMSE